MTRADIRSSSRPAPEGWVPVERRWLGVDRRTVGPALGVLVLAVLFAVVLPMVNAVVPYDDEVKAGDVMQLADDVRFTPTPGWGIVSGVRMGRVGRGGTYPAKTIVEKDTYALTVRVSAYQGTAADLLERLQAIRNHSGADAAITGRGAAIRTTSGIRGEIVRYANSETDGTLAAFVADGVGIEVTATGTRGTGDAATAGDVARMIRSVKVVAVPR